jgi:hypothetical protein
MASTSWCAHEQDRGTFLDERYLTAEEKNTLGVADG